MRFIEFAERRRIKKQNNKTLIAMNSNKNKFTYARIPLTNLNARQILFLISELPKLINRFLGTQES